VRSKQRFEVTNTRNNGRDMTPGLVMIFGQGGEMLFPILAASVGQGDGTGEKLEFYLFLFLC